MPFLHVSDVRIQSEVPAAYSEWREKAKRQSSFWRLKYGHIDANSELQRIASLKTNWDSYGADAPSENAIRVARSILSELEQARILPSAIVASATGGVSIYFFDSDRSAYIENYNDGAQALVMYDQNGTTEVLEIGTEIDNDALAVRILGYLG
jgi:hypothetical protein